MNTQPSTVELDHQIQGLPLTGYDDPFMRTLVLAVDHAAQARRFVGSLLRKNLLDFGGGRTGRPHVCGINIGFTYEGLRALDTSERVLAVLKQKSPAFADGAVLRAGRYLGDAGESAAERWDGPFHRQRAHVWISVHGQSATHLDDALKRLKSLEGAGTGLCGWDDHGIPEGAHMFLGPRKDNVRMVHFGFRDNITKPSILGKHRRLGGTGLDGKPLPKPGELLLGYPNNAGADIWTAQTTPGDVAAFLSNGSFGILRQIEQDVARFDGYVWQQVRLLRAKGYTFVTEDYLKAKMVGRWPNGSTVLPTDTRQPQPARLGPVDFEHDRMGWGCPFGAHIRRANPRGDPLLPPRERVLFRRGIPYTRGTEQGLLGVFFCARIEDQFELLISEWMQKNPLGPANGGRAKDPIAGQHDEPGAEFHIPLRTKDPIVLADFRPFVRTRGTLYALFPSRRALEAIAAGPRWGAS